VGWEWVPGRPGERGERELEGKARRGGGGAKKGKGLVWVYYGRNPRVGGGQALTWRRDRCVDSTGGQMKPREGGKNMKGRFGVQNGPDKVDNGGKQRCFTRSFFLGRESSEFKKGGHEGRTKKRGKRGRKPRWESG